MADVVAHEISHSWAGNLVTNRNFEHFWINEGFTMFVERKILGRLIHSDQRKFNAFCGLKDLRDEVCINIFKFDYSFIFLTKFHIILTSHIGETNLKFTT